MKAMHRIKYLLGTAVMIAFFAMILMPASEAFAADENHFFDDAGVLYIYDAEDNPVASSWSEIGGKWYYTDETGKVLKDQFVNAAVERFYVGSDGAMLVGFFTVDDVEYFATATGALNRGKWIKSGSDWYITDSEGRVLKDQIITSGGKQYYMDSDGKMKTGLIDVDGDTYFANASGEIRTKNGWLSYGGEWYFVNAGGKIRKNEAIWNGGTVYYAGPTGALVGGVYSVNGNLRYFESDGSAKKDAGWVKPDGVWYYVNKGGIIRKNAVVGTGSEMYYVGSDGKLTGGVHKVDGKYYFFYSSGKVKSKAGWVKYDGKWYFGDKGGVLRQNSIRWDGSKAYYLGDDAAMITSAFAESDGKLRYFNANGEIRKTKGWFKYKGAWYYAKTAGIYVTDATVKDKGKLYFLGKDGKMKTGWIKITDTKWYYADKSGALYAGKSFTVKGESYYAADDGLIILNSAVSKAQSYSSNTNYLILVNLKEQKTSIFKGQKGEWVPEKEFTCSTGTSAHPTPEGEYKTTMRTRYFNSMGYRCWWATGFIGGEYLFHSSPYTMTDSPEVCADYTMGRPSSHGCIRLKLDDALWIYDNVPIGSKVVIYK